MRLFANSFLLLGIAVMLLATAAGATQVLYRSVAQLGQQSSSVVRGQVSSVQSFWNANRTKIFTETVITVDENYKGNTTGTVSVLQLGGTVDNVKVSVHGALRWTPGEEVVVFLEPYQEGKFHVTGFSQGKFNVERDPRTNEAFITRPALGGAKLVGTPDSDVTTTQFTKVPLERFISQALGEDRMPDRR